MYTHYVKWNQERLWKLDFPPEMVFLKEVAGPNRRASKDANWMWDWYATPDRLQLNIYDEATIIVFKLKYSK